MIKKNPQEFRGLLTKILYLLIGMTTLASVVFLHNSLSQARNDADIINILGRQRMLSQSMAKSVLGFTTKKKGLQIIESDLADYETARSMFAKTLDAIRHGGSFPLDLDQTQLKHIPALTGKKIQAKLIEVNLEFTQFQQKVGTLLTQKEDSENFDRTRQEISLSTDRLTRLNDTLASLYTITTHNQQNRILWAFALTGSLVTLTVLTLAWDIIHRLRDKQRLQQQRDHPFANDSFWKQSTALSEPRTQQPTPCWKIQSGRMN